VKNCKALRSQQKNIDLEIRHHPSPRNGLVTMPSPLGEGQTDMPINCLNQGEVTNPSPVSPEGGEANSS